MENIAYKAFKRTVDGSLVSMIVPKWNPLYRVYRKAGINQFVNNGFVFGCKMDLEDWVPLQLNNGCDVSCELKRGESVELWEVEYDEILNKGFILPAFCLVDKECFKDFKKVCTELGISLKDKDILIATSKMDYIYRSIQIDGSFIASNIKLISRIGE